MKPKHLLLVALILVLLCFAVMTVMGRTCVYTLHTINMAGEASDYTVSYDPDPPPVELTDRVMQDGRLTLTFRSVHPGAVYFTVDGPEGFSYLEKLYVHRLGAISVDTLFGPMRGGRILPIASAVFLALLLWTIIRRYRADMRRTIYQYRNIRNLGWIIFVAGLLLGQVQNLLVGNSVIDQLTSTMNAASMFSIFAFPVAFVVSILVAFTSARLMRREGRTWRNMLGLILGVLICLGTLAPTVLEEFSQRTMLFDAHNERGAALYIVMAITNGMLIIVTYLECILLSTIILSVKAARRTPALDKDYVIIHGCQIKKDGSLTPLLRGRADAALAFARLQREQTGKELVFIPSGGQGADECISEAEAIRRYLLESGVPEARILPEDQSENTEANLRNSAALIREREGGDDAKIAIATTNYHVFRAGLLAEEMGIHAEGVGGKTRTYFWINAFVREFIATLWSERRRHALIVALLVLLTLLGVWTVYLSVVL